jgi:hypothetical protein
MHRMVTAISLYARPNSSEGSIAPPVVSRTPPEPGRPGLAGGHVGQRLPGHAHAPQPLDHARPLTSLRWWSLDSHLLALSAPSAALDRPRPPCHSYREYSQRGSEYVGPPDPSGPSAVKRSPAAVRRTCLPLIVQPPEEVLVREPITIRTTLTRQTSSQTVKCSLHVWAATTSNGCQHFRWSEPMWWARQGLNL